MYFKGLQLSRSYLPRQFLCCAFSTSEQKLPKLKSLSDSAQKAIWAQHVIRSIMDLPPPTSIKDKSLREKIIQLKLQNTGYNLNEENRKEVIKMFKEGVQVDKNVYDQTRVIDAILTDKGSTTVERPLIFCPNYSVTRQIFTIINEPNLSSLIYGGYGISKTIGIIMYSKLVLFKSKFMMEARNDSYKKNELQQLIEKKLINPNSISKCWYWSIKQKKFFTFQEEKQKQFIRNLLLMQATELPKEQIQRLQMIESYQQFQKQLLLIYQQAKILQRVIFDQINSVASMMRKINVVVQQRQKRLAKLKIRLKMIQDYQQQERQNLRREMKSIQDRYAQKLKNLDSNRQKVMHLLQYINTFKAYGRSFIFNSSMNFQLEYLQSTFSFSKDMLTFDVMGYHQRFYLNRINYVKDIQKQLGKIDFYHFFWFQIMRLLSARNVPEDVLESVKQQIYEIIASAIAIKRYYRFIFINQILMRKISKFQDFNQNSTKEDILSLLNQIIVNFDENCIQKSRENVVKFKNKREQSMQDRSDKKIEKEVTKIVEKAVFQRNKVQDEKIVQQDYTFNQRFTQLLYMLAEQGAKVGNEQMVYSIQSLDFLMGQNVLLYLTNKDYNNQFIPIDINYYQKTVNFLYSPQQFLTIAQEIVNPRKKDFYNEVWNKTCLSFSKDNASYRGMSLQAIFLKTLIPKTIMRFPIFNNIQKPKPKQNKYRPEDYIQLSVQILQKSFFFSLTKKSNFFENMSTILSQSQKKPDLWFVGQPKKKNLKHDPHSPSIDFMFVRYNQVNGIHQIYTFDMTINHNVLTKENDVSELFDQIFMKKKPQGQKRQFQINHFIICHRDAIRPKKEYKLPLPEKQKETTKDGQQIEKSDKLQPKVKKQIMPQEQMAASCLIDNKITVSYVSLDQMQVVRCFDTGSFFGFKYFQDWTCKTRIQQQAEKRDLKTKPNDRLQPK